MARRVFFSFHFGNDNWRANQVRNSWVTKPDHKSAGFWDAAVWEQVKKQSEESIKRWIRDQMKNTSVTVVLIGIETSERKFVRYEIQHSWDRDNGLIGVYIHRLKDRFGNTCSKGKDPFVAMCWKGFYTYDWIEDDGYNNLGAWVEGAAQRVGGRKK